MIVKPDSALLAAIAALLNGTPEQPVEIIDGCFIRASFLVEACAPEIVASLDAAARYVEMRDATIHRIAEYGGVAS